MVFNAGDEIVVLRNCSGAIAGQSYTLTRTENGTLRTGGGIAHCSCKHNWQLLKNRNVSKSIQTPLFVSTPITKWLAAH